MKVEKVLGQFVLGNKLKRQKRRVKVFNLKTAKTALIIYNSSDPFQEETVRNFARFLKEERIKVNTLGFFKRKTKKDDLPKDELEYKYFDKEFLNWYGLLKNSEIKAIQDREFDLLVDLNIDDIFCLEAISSLSPAHFKVGKAGDYRNAICDLTISTEETGVDYLIDQMKNYLSIINN